MTSQVGFFAEAGPLQVFVSGHLIPEDFEYNQVDEPAFVSADEEVRIQQGTEVRLRIMGTRTDASEIVSLPLLSFQSLLSCLTLLSSISELTLVTYTAKQHSLSGRKSPIEIVYKAV